MLKTDIGYRYQHGEARSSYLNLSLYSHNSHIYLRFLSRRIKYHDSLALVSRSSSSPFITATAVLGGLICVLGFQERSYSDFGS